MQTGLTSFLDKVIARGAMRASGESAANGVGDRIGDGGFGESVGRKSGDAEGHGTGSTFAAEFARMIRVLRAEAGHPRHADDGAMDDVTPSDGEAAPDTSEDVEARGMPMTAGSFAWRWHHETGVRAQDIAATQATQPDAVEAKPQNVDALPEEVKETEMPLPNAPDEALEALPQAPMEDVEDISVTLADDPTEVDDGNVVPGIADAPATEEAGDEVIATTVEDVTVAHQVEAEPELSVVEDVPAETTDNAETDVRAQAVPVSETNPVQDAIGIAESPAAKAPDTSSLVTVEPSIKNSSTGKTEIDEIAGGKERPAIVAEPSSGRAAKHASGAVDAPAGEGEAPDAPTAQNAPSQQSALGKNAGGEGEPRPDTRQGNRPAGEAAPRGTVGQVKVDVVSGQTHLPPAPPATVQLLGDTIGEALKELANTRFAGEAAGEVPNQGEPAQPGASRRMVVDLHPRDLGTVRVTLVNRAGELHIEIVSSTDKATDLLNSHRDALAQSIRQAGSAVTEISVRAAQDGGTGREFQGGQQQAAFSWSGGNGGNGGGGEKSGGAQHPFSDVPQGGQPRPNGDGKSETQADIRSGIYL